MNFLFLLGFLALGWCWWSRVWGLVLVFIGVLGFWGFQRFIQIPSQMAQLQTLVTSASPIWIQGRIASMTSNEVPMKIRLVRTALSGMQFEQSHEEIELVLQSSQKSRWIRGSWIEIVGVLKHVSFVDQRLQLTLNRFRKHPLPLEQSPILCFFRSVKEKLKTRASFYLSSAAYGLYAPSVLGESIADPETRTLFQETGLSHLLVISGLHIVLLYGMFLKGVQKCLGWCSPLLQQRYFLPMTELLVLIVLWIYLAFLEFPVPALRSGIMISIMVIVKALGQAHSSLYALFLTASFCLVWHPSLVNDVSFQLSFVATLAILVALPFCFSLEGKAWWWQPPFFIWNTVFSTISVLLWLWPILSLRFGKISLEGLWLNVAMVPLFSILILPAGCVSLVVSLFLLDQPPFSTAEFWSFRLTQVCFDLWCDLLRFAHQFGTQALVKLRLEWTQEQHALYYLSLAVGWLLLHQAVALVKKRRSLSALPLESG